MGLLSPILSHLGQQGPRYPSTAFVYSGLGCGLVATVRTFGDNAGGQTQVKNKCVFTAVREFPRLWRKTHSKFSVFQCGQVGGCRHGLPSRMPIKENPGDPGHQLAANDGHSHTPRKYNLNYTIWTL